jgi:hypothetical protein
MRALSVAVKPMDQGRTWKHGEDLTDWLTDQGVGVFGHGVLTVAGLQNAGKLPNRGTYAGIRGAQGRVMASPAAGYGVVGVGGPGGEG